MYSAQHVTNMGVIKTKRKCCSYEISTIYSYQKHENFCLKYVIRNYKLMGPMQLIKLLTQNNKTITHKYVFFLFFLIRIL
jgi:hypothetical protein